MNTVADIPESHTLISDGMEQTHILESVGEDPSEWDHGRVFVCVENAEYRSIVWYPGRVPYLQKTVTEIR